MSINLNYLTLAIAVINLILGIVVLSSSPQKALSRYFFVFSASLSLWAFANFYFLQFSQTVGIFRTTYSTGGLALALALPWVILITEKRITRFHLTAVGILAGIIAWLPYYNGSVIKSLIHLTDKKFEFISGPLFNLYGGLLLVLLFYLLYKLVVAYLKSRDGEKVQLGYILFGISIFAAVSFVFGVVLPLFNIKSVVAFDAQSSLLWVGLTTYAITKHGLFNIKVIATQIFIGVLLILILTRILSASTTADIVFESIVMALTAVVGYFLVRSVKNEVKRREEVETLAKEKTAALKEVEQRNKNLATLQRISELVLNEVELKPMTQKILDEIPKQLAHSTGALLDLTKDGHLMAYSVSAHEMASRVASMVGADLTKYSYPIRHDFNQIHAALVDKRVYESANLSDFISPPIAKPVAMTLQKLLGIRHIIAQPLYAGGEPLGVLVFTYHVAGDELDQRDRDMAKAVADNMAIALQRAYAYQKLKEANEYLAELDKTKNDFISMASHELNTPLAAIEGYLSMVLDEGLGKVDPKAKVYLTRAYASSKRLAALILDLLNVSRIEQGRLKMKFAKTNLVDLAASVIDELQIKTDAKKLYLKLEATKSKVPDTWCDPDRIREIFVNLIGNATKFTEKGGITVRVKEELGKLRCEVADTGRGVSKEDQKKLFQKFSQVHRELDQQQGTGLGLYISKTFTELHNGRIFVESEAGKGATFIFELPILKSAPKEVAGAILEDKSINASTIEAAAKPEADPTKLAVVTKSDSS